MSFQNYDSPLYYRIMQIAREKFKEGAADGLHP